MRKLLLAALAVAVAVAGFAAISQGNSGEAGTSWEFKYKPAKKDKPAGTDSDIRPAKKQADGSYAEVRREPGEEPFDSQEFFIARNSEPSIAAVQ